MVSRIVLNPRKKRLTLRQRLTPQLPDIRALPKALSIVGAGIALGFVGVPAAIGRVALPLVSTPLRALGTLTGIGILSVSPKARSLVDPFKAVERGRGIGGIIEDPSKLLPKEKTGPSVRDRILDVGKTAGIIGAGAAGLVGGAILAKKGVEKVKGLFPKKSIVEPVLALDSPFAVLPSAAALTPTTEPLGAVQPTEKPIEEGKAPVSMPSIKITNKPQINISFRKSRKFINQQVMIKQ